VKEKFNAATWSLQYCGVRISTSLMEVTLSEGSRRLTSTVRDPSVASTYLTMMISLNDQRNIASDHVAGVEFFSPQSEADLRAIRQRTINDHAFRLAQRPAHRAR